MSARGATFVRGLLLLKKLTPTSSKPFTLVFRHPSFSLPNVNDVASFSPAVGLLMALRAYPG
jgi:hypothetical protein